MWPFKIFNKPTPPSSEYDEPWRSLDWNKDSQNILKKINDFKPRNKEINTLRILLYGPQGAGKSSFFNSVNNTLQGRITTRALAQSTDTGESFTLKCNTYKMKKGEAGFFYPFTFTDIAGIHNQSNSIMANDIHRLLNGHIIDGYTFNPVSSITEDDPKYKRNPILKDRIHCLVAVLPAITVSLMHEEVFAQMRAVREKARDLGIPQAIIMTKVDEACPLVKENLEKIYKSKRIKQKMDDCSSRLGVPMSFIYPVKNYHEEHAINVKMDVLILDALQNIVNFANDYVEDQIDNKSFQTV
ncbi:interferon-induced protein 44-like isoform X1 [Cyprinus carpio]|uniref:Interferon-induced protein 44-like isoform X1 n=1 Tax=Cyprinus carpio TaxID=7962 RepID=A0A9Q9YSE2_CYPCA|nr:interferon-induced protein 44-like isoform X1 [Cyprinus carpio]XP_042624890.1 interferon-induced protein 44-like isoform X1 [Cyprinus carpio]